MARIGFLGLGAMGARMAKRCLAAGHAVTVWNRTPDRATALADEGAEVAETPADAARGADAVLSMVRDDDASRHVWCAPDTGALAGMEPNALAIESSTLTLDWVRELAACAEAAGVRFLDAPVAGSRPQADTGQLIYFVGGTTEDCDAAEPILRAMGGAVHYAGPAGSGAGVKLAVNALFGIELAALGELIGMLDRAGLDAAAAIAILSETPVCSPAAKMASGAMLGGQFAPAFPIDLVEKDFGYVAAAAQSAQAEMPLAAAARQTYKSAIAKGFGDDNITGVVQLYR